MSFTSGARRPNDPEPWHAYLTTRNGRSKLWRGTAKDWDDACARAEEAHPKYRAHTVGRIPRPEFDLPSRKDVNPILSAYRAHVGPDTASEFFDWAFLTFDAFGGWTAWEDASHPAHSFTTATPEQVEHARAVLSRLRRLTY